MNEVLALMRAGWLTRSSYRLRTVLSLVSLLAAVVPVYFVANALQPTMAGSITAQGGEYFGFLLLGLIALAFLATAVNALPAAIGSSIASGTLEALLATRIRLPQLLLGLIGHAFVWTALRATLLLAAGWMLGVEIAWGRSLMALLVLALLVLAYLPFGLFAAAMVLAFRTAGPLPRGVLVVSGLLGGAYYPTGVIPSWLQAISAAVPLTYGLRALRQLVLERMPIGAVLPDVAVLLGFAAVLLGSSIYALTAAFGYARRSGTLAQY